MTLHYCAYCGRVEHRCHCADENSRAHHFFTRGQTQYSPQWMDRPYKRGVPPQIKQRERRTLRRHYAQWYTALVEAYGAWCANCGIAASEMNLVVDHVLSVAKGGLSVLDNLQLLCAECNRIKGKLCIDRRSDSF